MIRPAELKTHLDRLGVSPMWFAQRAGLHVQSVYRYYSPARADDIPEPTARVLRALLEARAAAEERGVAAAEASGYVTRYPDHASFGRAYPELADWPEEAQGALLAAITNRLPYGVEYA